MPKPSTEKIPHQEELHHQVLMAQFQGYRQCSLGILATNS